MKLAIFIGSDALEEILESGDVTYGNITPILQKMYKSEIDKVIAYHLSHPFGKDDVSDFFPEDVFARLLVDNASQIHGNALAAYLGFCAGYGPEDTFSAVIDIC